MKDWGFKFLLGLNAALRRRGEGELLSGLDELFGRAVAEVLQLVEFSLVEVTIWVMSDGIHDFADGIVEHHLDLLDAAALRGATSGLWREN